MDAIVQETLTRLTGLCLLIEGKEVLIQFGIKSTQFGFRVSPQPKVPLFLTQLKGFSPPNNSEEMVTIDYQTLKRVLNLTSFNLEIELKQTFSRLTTLKVVSLKPNLSKLKTIRKILATFAPQLVELQLFIESSEFEDELYTYGRGISNSVFSQMAYLFDDLNRIENYPKLKHLTLHLNECLFFSSNLAKDKDNSNMVDENSENEEDYEENSEEDSGEDSKEDSENFEELRVKSKALILLGQVEEVYLSVPFIVITDNIAALGDNPNLVKLGIIISGIASYVGTSTILEAIAETYPSLAEKVVHLLEEKSELNFLHLSRYYPFERPLLAHQFNQLTHLNASLKTAQYVTILKELGSTSGGSGNFNQSLRELCFTLRFVDTAEELSLLEVLDDAQPLPLVTAFTLELHGNLEKHETFEKIAPVGRLFFGGLRFFYLELWNCLGDDGLCTSCSELENDCLKAMLKPVVTPLQKLERLKIVTNFEDVSETIGDELMAEINKSNVGDI